MAIPPQPFRTPRRWVLTLWMASAVALGAQVVPGRNVFTMGGAVSTGGPYRIIDTAGLPCTGEQASPVYGMDHGFWPGTVNPPQAAQDLVLRATNRIVKVRFPTLLTNDADPDDDAIAVIELAARSTFGASLLVDNGWIVYQAAAGFNQEDSFAYTIADADGEEATGTVVVRLMAESPQQYRTLVSLKQLEDGRRQMSFIGIAGRAYMVQATENLGIPVWRNLGICTAGANGLFDFLDSELPAPPQRYYRVVAP